MYENCKEIDNLLQEQLIYIFIYQYTKQKSQENIISWLFSNYLYV